MTDPNQAPARPSELFLEVVAAYIKARETTADMGERLWRFSEMKDALKRERNEARRAAGPRAAPSKCDHDYVTTPRSSDRRYCDKCGEPEPRAGEGEDPRAAGGVDPLLVREGLAKANENAEHYRKRAERAEAERDELKRLAALTQERVAELGKALGHCLDVMPRGVTYDAAYEQGMSVLGRAEQPAPLMGVLPIMSPYGLAMPCGKCGKALSMKTIFHAVFGLRQGRRGRGGVSALQSRAARPRVQLLRGKREVDVRRQLDDLRQVCCACRKPARSFVWVKTTLATMRKHRMHWPFGEVCKKCAPLVRRKRA